MDELRRNALRAARESRNAGRLAEAYQGYADAASLARNSQQEQMRAHALRHVSDVGREIGKLTEALASGQEAVALYIADPGATALDLANALRVTALAWRELGQKDAAKPIWAEARELYAEAGVNDGVAECDDNL